MLHVYLEANDVQRIVEIGVKIMDQSLFLIIDCLRMELLLKSPKF